MPEVCLVEGKLKKVWVAERQRYAYLPVGSPHICDSEGGVLDA